MVTMSFALGSRLSKSLGLLVFHESLFTCVRKEGVYVRNSVLPTADPELFINE